jgi:hypothetical protein
MSRTSVWVKSGRLRRMGRGEEKEWVKSRQSHGRPSFLKQAKIESHIIEGQKEANKVINPRERTYDPYLVPPSP